MQISEISEEGQFTYTSPTWTMMAEWTSAPAVIKISFIKTRALKKEFRSSISLSMLVRNHKIMNYWAGGSFADYDRDGRIDFFGPEWYPEDKARLLRNVTPMPKTILMLNWIWAKCQTAME